MKIRLREATDVEKRHSRTLSYPLLATMHPPVEGDISIKPQFQVLEQWNEHRGGWFPVPNVEPGGSEERC